MNSSNHINPDIFSITACVVGAISVSDFNDYELNSIGNWLILVGQYMLTYAAQMQLIHQSLDLNNINVNSRQCKNGGSPYINNGKSNQTQRMEVDFLLDAITKIQKELDEIKNSKN